ncbi:serine hydrolase domain-containing protein [Chryseobacterium sp. CBSDS_008]|uniref:serine hydrolase domain-containing protein n=1 Tax=Chryseobacterium sp. CBSDS_008 TaxID=3415265 RepID=UPI003CF33BE9
MKTKFQFIFIFLIACYTNAQNLSDKIDNIRIKYQIPALEIAVISSDSILEMGAFGTNKINSNLKITLKNRFHLGSNTKAITSFIAANLVLQGKINWNTNFFHLFPELETKQNQSKGLTLINLLNFKVPLSPFSYDTQIPESVITTGTNQEQRYNIAKYLLTQKAVKKNNDNLFLTNLGYLLAGLMLEKVSKKNYNELVNDVNKELNIDFKFGNPNTQNEQQTYGHNELLIPITEENIKLNWLLSAGNINTTLPDYSLYIQNYLQGIEGKGKQFNKETFEQLLFGFPIFSFGWFSKVGKDGNSYINNFGNANGYMSSVSIFKEKKIAVIIFSNLSSKSAKSGIDIIFEILADKYCSKHGFGEMQD